MSYMSPYRILRLDRLRGCWRDPLR
ncbi:protein of unknown function (plasmid) [Azospirillum baldaniorum]|uniref:Uncharacterized protein n=1 Tax=Azospirillum baldaniorum TaxID=1064539 RepID=A0A9P1NP66_9PROT|nr:protein of unknown function [Azospirillum baldaniorum]